MKGRTSRLGWALILASACTPTPYTSPDAARENGPQGGDTASSNAGDDAPPPQDSEPCGPESSCGVDCALVNSDPNNCGSCYRTCIIPNAVAGCDAGECSIGECDAGFFDRDGDVANGCEVRDTCVPNTTCATNCGSSGTIACADGNASCLLPAESCNMADDNCDGQCDDGAISGCRVGIHRSSGNGHLYTTDLVAADTTPYNLEAADYFHVYTDPAPDTQPMFLCRKANGKALLTSETACEVGRAPDRILGYWSPSEQCGSVPLYRLHHAPSDNHFYTLHTSERDNAVNNLGYVAEGIAGYVWRAL